MDILNIENCTIRYQEQEAAVEHVSLSVGEQEIVSIVGESGSGKTTLIRAILGILPPGGTVTEGKILFQGKNILELDETSLQKLRGTEIAMIFQDVGASLDPIRIVESQKKVVTHRFEPTSKNVLLFIGSLALSLVISIWGNLTQWRKHQDREEADLKYRALKMVLSTDDPNIHYIEKYFSICRDENVINNVRNRVAAYEDSVRHHYKMIEMATYKDSLTNCKLLEIEGKNMP